MVLSTLPSTAMRYFPRLEKNKLRILLFGLLCVFFSILYCILISHKETDEASFKSIDIEIPKDFQPVYITQREMFPSKGPYKIPKIIHQTWKDKHIPKRFVHWIKSWLLHHPGWEYWLWTYESAGKFVADKYPHLLDVFFGYPKPIRRADAMRYAVLHEYGGIYADMDMEALSPLDPLSLKYPCFIGQEPYEHPILDTNFEQLLINALIGCRKGHPFMKTLMDNLPAYAHMFHDLDSAGPHFVTAVYQKYLKEFEISHNSSDTVYVPPSEYFYPKIDPHKIHSMMTKFQKPSSTLSKLQVKACRNLKFKHSQVDFNPKSVAFTDHHWCRSYINPDFSSRSSYSHEDIYDICPNVKIYNGSKV